MKIKSHLIAIALLLSIPVFSASAATVSVYAGYDYDDPDYIANSYFTIVNDTDYSITNISITAVGDGDGDDSALTDSAIWAWDSDILSSDELTLYFPEDGANVTGSGWGFTADYGWYYSGNDQVYTVSFEINGETYTVTFSASDNLSETFIAFLGNDEYGDYLPLDASGLVAQVTISDAASVPLPGSIVIMFAGLSSLIASRRWRR